MEDVLRSVCAGRAPGWTGVMNITDVGAPCPATRDTGEDKMLAGGSGAQDRAEIAKFYTDAFLTAKKLHIRKPDTVVPATTCVPTSSTWWEALLRRATPTRLGVNVYFDTSKLENYYVFGNQSGEDLAVGVTGVAGPEQEQDPTCAVVHQVQVRDSGLGSGSPPAWLSWLAH